MWLYENSEDEVGLGYGLWLTGLNTKLFPKDFVSATRCSQAPVGLSCDSDGRCKQGHVNVTIVDNTFHAAGDRATPAHWGKNTTGSGKHAIAVQSGTLLTLHGTSQRFSGKMQMGDR